MITTAAVVVGGLSGRVTTEHAMSSHGIPVLVFDADPGRAYGAGDTHPTLGPVGCWAGSVGIVATSPETLAVGADRGGGLLDHLGAMWEHDDSEYVREAEALLRRWQDAVGVRDGE
jgi:hypothetical protein